MNLKILKKALWITGLIHLFLIVIGTIVFYGDQAEYGTDYWDDVVWSEYMFLVFVPITYAIVFFFVLILDFLNQKKDNR